MTLNDSLNVSLSNMPERSISKYKNISSLNAVCLENIFSNFTILELLKLRSVCSEWKACIDSIFTRTHVIQIFANRLEFKRFQVAMHVRYLHFGKYYLFESQPQGSFILRPNVCSNEIIEILPKLFPNIRRLVFQRCTNIYQNGIAKLIRKCSSLIEISFGYMPANDQIDEELWPTLDTSTQIKSIMFHNLYQTNIPNELSLLKHIQCFHIAHYRCSLVPILSQLGPNCWRIFLTWVYLTSEELECAISKNPMLAIAVTSLRLEYIASYENRESNYKKLIHTFVTHFKSIDQLDICFGDHLDFSFLIPKLHCLPHLRELFLYFGSSQIPKKEHLNREIRPLNTVVSLVLESYKLSGEELLFFISFMFPSLEQLNIHCQPPDWRVDADKLKDSFFVSLSKLKYFNIKVG